MTPGRPVRWLGIGLIAGLAGLLAICVFARPAMLDLVTNSDALLPADLVWEMLHRPQSWRSFGWPRIPSLVPDLAVYAPLQAAFGWRWAQLGYSALSLMALTGLASAIGPDLEPVERRHAGACFLALAALAFLGEWAMTATAWHMHLLAAAYHSGPFIASVAALLLARRGGGAGLAAMVALAAAATFSDRMFVGTFLLPLLVSLFVLWRQGEQRVGPAIRLAVLASAGCALGLLADRLLFPAVLSRQADVPLAPLAMLRHAAAFAADRSGWFVAALDAAILIPLACVRRPPSARFWWIAAAAAAIPSSLLAAGLWEDDGGQRYLSAALWWPLVLAGPALARRIGRPAPAPALALALATTLGVVACFGWRIPQRHPLLAWTDPIAACLAPTGLTEGLAEYWQARRISVASDWRLAVLQIGPQGGARYWGNDPTWYTTSRSRPGTPPPLHFIVMQGLDTAAIRRAYGAPDRVLPCPGSDVWIYGDAARVRAGLAAASPGLVAVGQSVCVAPSRLRRRGGALPAGPINFAADRRTSRPATWGPDLDLHPGRWRVTLHYRLTTGRPGQDRFLVNGLHGTLHLAEAILPDTHGAVGVVSAEIVANREIEAVEVPTYLAGQATLEILGVAFVPEGALDNAPCDPQISARGGPT